MNHKHVLVDCDGVLLNWYDSFLEWRKDNYVHIKEQINPFLIESFNTSSAIGYLPPILDSVKYLKKIYSELGTVFTVITSLSDNVYSKKLRIMNLNAIFGQEIFKDIIILPTMSCKYKTLLQFSEPHFFIDDLEQNLDAASSCGHIPLHFVSRKCQGISKHKSVYSWREIFQLLKETEELHANL